MQKLNEILRGFNLTYGSLIQKTDDLILSAIRDLIDLAKFGMTQQKIDKTQLIRDEFVDMPTDQELLGNQIRRTEEKSQMAEQLRTDIKNIGSRIMLKFGKKSWQYRTANIGEVSQLVDEKLCRTGYSLVRTATELLEELADTGLTQEIIDLLKTHTQQFDELIDLKQKAINQRDIKTQDRRVKANELYANLMHISETGKATYQGTNEAKYNDYVIYNTASGTKNAEGYGMLTGSISGDDDMLLQDAVVKAKDTELTATSNQSGEYIMENIPAGIYSFTVSAEGYKTTVFNNIEIESGETKEIDFELMGVEV